MLKSLKTTLLLLFLSSIFISCEKEMFDDPTPMYSMENVEWVLYSGRVYVENAKYIHFLIVYCVGKNLNLFLQSTRKNHRFRLS